MEMLFHAGLSNAVSATVLALLVACLARPLARRPAVLHGLWLLVLVKLVAPPLYEVPIPWPTSSAVAQEPARIQAAVWWEGAGEDTSARETPSLLEAPVEAMAVQAEQPELDLVSALGEDLPLETPPRGGSLNDWFGAIAAIWVIGAVATLFVAGRRIRRFQRLLHEARPASQDEQEWVKTLAGRLGLRRMPGVSWVHGPLAPMVWSLGWRPRLIIPTDLWKTLDERQRATLIVHELAHLRRGDHCLRFFEFLVTALYWWHPLVWWVRRALRDAEEQCCDAWVVWAFPDAARSYAETLLETLDFLHQSDRSQPLLASGFGQVHHLRRRLTMIMNGTTPRLMGIGGGLGLLGLAAVLLPVGAAWAQKPEEPEKVQVVVKAVDDLAKVVDEPAAEAPKPQRFVTHSRVTAVEDASSGRLFLTLQTDDSPERTISGSLEQVLAQLKQQLGEIAKKSPRSEHDELRRKTLEHAIAEVAKVAGEIKGLGSSFPKARQTSQETTFYMFRPVQPAEKKGRNDHVVRRIEQAEKEATTEKKAEIEEITRKVGELRRELNAKLRDLEAAQERLAKLGAGMGPAPVLPIEFQVSADKARGPKLRVMVQTDESPGGGWFGPLEQVLDKLKERRREIDKKTPLSERDELRRQSLNRAIVELLNLADQFKRDDSRPAKPDELKVQRRVVPSQGRIELKIGSDDGLVPGHALNLGRVLVGTVKAPSGDQRIEELERALKKLIHEVESLKKDRAKDSPRK